MDWLDCLSKALNYIEDNLENNIEAEDISKNIYISQFYLQKGFNMLTGYSLGEYIRNRRLYEAAKLLAYSNERVIDVAMRYCWDSPDSFSKAFLRFHGALPSAVKRNPSLIKSFLPLKISITISGGEKMDFTVSPMWGFKIIGFEREFGYEEAYREIPKFWDEICEKYCKDIYAGKEPTRPEERAIMDNCIGEYAVCIDDIGGGKFRYIIGGKYAGGEVPDTMKLAELPKCDWAKFKAVGKMPDALQSLNTKIFKEWLPTNGEYEIAAPLNIEWYSCDKDKDQDDYESGIWVPVKKK